MERTETLCWDCQRAFGNEQCSWARGFQPVQGWEAIDTRLRSVSNGTIRSYRVSACPTSPVRPQKNSAAHGSKLFQPPGIWYDGARRDAHGRGAVAGNRTVDGG